MKNHSRTSITKACALTALVITVGLTCTFAMPQNAEASAQKPAKVTQVKISKITATSAKISWKKVKGATYYELHLTGNDDDFKYNDSSTRKSSYTFDRLNPSKHCGVKVRAISIKSGKIVKGKWSSKKTFKVKSAVISKHSLSGTLGEGVSYKLSKAETRKTSRYENSRTLVVFYTATNNTQSDKTIGNPSLNAYQKGIKLEESYSALGLENSMFQTLAPGYSLNSWMGFKLRDHETPVMLRSTQHNYDTDTDSIIFEYTIELT